jgi:prevent-host-death family protein
VESITANELKTRGISVVEERMKLDDEVIISVRGRSRFVVMSLEKYSKLREYELDLAIQEAQADYQAGRVITESVEEHMKRVSDAL